MAMALLGRLLRPLDALNDMEMFRSEEMQLVQLIIPAEAAHDTVSQLGEAGLIEFKDLNADKSAFQRTYANQVKRCDEMLRKLRFFAEQITKADLVAVPRTTRDKAYELDELEVKLDELERELLEINGNVEKLRRSHSELMELQLVLEKAGSFFRRRAQRCGPCCRRFQPQHVLFIRRQPACGRGRWRVILLLLRRQGCASGIHHRRGAQRTCGGV